MICGAAALFAAGMLFLILGIIFLKGVASLNPHFILFSEINTGMGLGTGIANAIVGTILLALTSTILAIPFGVGTAIYLKKYAPDNHITRFLRLMIEVLSGIPSILLGIVALFILVVYLKPITGGESLFAGSVALAALILPVIERATEDAIVRVPKELEEGSYALGATKWLTIRDLVIPSAFSGIIVGAILGFGRAAEESAVVLLTAGYSQYMPEFRITLNPQLLLGIKIFPLNNLVGTLPVFLYNAYENSNVFPESSIFAAGFVLIMIVLLVNLSAKVILFHYTATAQGQRNNLISSFFGDISGKFLTKKPKDIPAYNDAENDPLAPTDLFSEPEEIPHPETAAEPAQASQFSSDSNTPPEILSAVNTRKPSPSGKKASSAVASVTQLISKFRQKIHVPVPGKKDQTEGLRDIKQVNRGRIWSTIRFFLFTFTPFALVAALLIFLTVVLPSLSSVGPNGGPAGSLSVLFLTIVICAISIAPIIFVVLRSPMFLVQRQKSGIGNTAALITAIAIGLCLIFLLAFIFSVHILSQGAPIQSPAGDVPSGFSGSLSSFNIPGSYEMSGTDEIIQGLTHVNIPEMLQGFSTIANDALGFTGQSEPLSTSNTMNMSDRAARLAALVASEGSGGDNTTPEASQAQLSQTAVAAPTPNSQTHPPANAGSPVYPVPVKNALSLHEYYQYGDSTHMIRATIYDTKVLPFYFWWYDDYKRFEPAAPALGDEYLVTFIKIENTGEYDALIPSADQFNLTYDGMSYVHQPFLNTSLLDQNQITEYSNNYNEMPYQWIRELGQDKRDYAFLTEYPTLSLNGTFSQTTGTITGNSTSATISSLTTSYSGFFIPPGASNAIDGYLIYEVPEAAASDLRNVYLHVSFNNQSATCWSLG